MRILERPLLNTVPCLVCSGAHGVIEANDVVVCKGSLGSVKVRVRVLQLSPQDALPLPPSYGTTTLSLKM